MSNPHTKAIANRLISKSFLYLDFEGGGVQSVTSPNRSQGASLNISPDRYFRYSGL